MPTEVKEISRSTAYSDLPDWLTCREVASYLGLSYWTVNEYVNRGRFPSRIFGKKIRHISKKCFDPERREGAKP